MKHSKEFTKFIMFIFLFMSCSHKSEKYIDEKGGFAIMFPDLPVVSEEQVDSELGKTILHSFIYKSNSNKDDNLSYELYYFDNPKSYTDTLSLDEKYSLLNGGQYSNLNNSNLELLNSTNIDICGNIGREYRWLDKKSENLTRVQFYLVDNREYILSVTTRNENNYNISINDFFNSFELLDQTWCKEKITNDSKNFKSYYNISFPGKTETRDVETPTIDGNLKTFVEAYQPKMVNDENIIYMISVTKFPNDITSSDTFNLKEYFNETIQNVLTSRQSDLISKKEIVYEGIKGIEFKESFKNGEILILNRSFLINDIQLGLQVMTIPKNEDNKSMLNFINSLEIIK